MSTTTTPAPTRATSALDPARARSVGLPTGVGLLIVCSVGMALAFDNRVIIDQILSMGWLTLGLLPFVGGYIAAGREELEGIETAPQGPADVVTGALTGLWAGALLAVFVVVLATIGDSLRSVLIQLSPQLLEMLTFGRGTATGVAIALLLPAATGALGGLVRITAAPLRRAILLAAAWLFGIAVLESIVTGVLDNLTDRIQDLGISGFSLEWLEDLLYASRGLTITGAVLITVVAVGVALAMGARGGGREQRQATYTAPTTASRARFYGGILAAAVILPLLFDRSVNDMLINVVIFGIMALGLNMVIGLTGMLDLGYVAFFAVGAYVTAVLTAPASNLTYSPELSFWVALPIALLVAVAAGLLIGTPVIRLRGDYLAIVTLGFAAIAQVLVLSDWFSPVLGGPQGVSPVPPVSLGFTEVSATVDPRGFLWLSLGFLAVTIYVAWRLQHSRMGRAWQAIREDETVAEAMGINIGANKLLAFCVGAVFAALAGGLFAAKVSSAFPTSFELLVSVLVLVVVIVGGTGYVPGVLLGSLVLVGVLGGPTTQGLLAEFANYKLLIYGALLVAMMLLRPQGLLPKPDKGREIAQEEMDQDAWFDKNVGGSSDVAASRRDGDPAAPTSSHDTTAPGGGETTVVTDPKEGEA